MPCQHVQGAENTVLVERVPYVRGCIHTLDGAWIAGDDCVVSFDFV